MRRSLLILASLLLAFVVVVGWWWTARSGDEVAERVSIRLRAVLGGECQVGEARVLSPRRVELRDVACVLDEGPVVGFAATHTSVEFGSPYLGSLPPVSEVVVHGGHVRARLPIPGDDDDDSGDDDDDDDSAEDVSLSAVLERLAVRFLDTHERLSRRPGGERVPSVLERLAPDAHVRFEGITIDVLDPPSELPMPRELSARLDRDGETLAVGVAASLATGGTVTARGRLSPDGLDEVTLGLDSVDLVTLLSRTNLFDIKRGAVSGSIAFRASDGSWPLDLQLTAPVVVHEFLGSQPAELPTVGLSGRVIRSEDSLILREGAWSVQDVGGELDVRAGPFDASEPPRVAAHLDGRRLALGKLLGALPETLLPGDWAEEIQGTMDLQADLAGPVHDRSAWEMDWQADFSRVVLADGELARQARQLAGPFAHHLPPASPGGPEVQRIIGPEDPHFVPLEQVSAWLRYAVISTEDAGFFQHAGFEVSELKEALLENLREGDGRGGSTITQQLAKNLFLSRERTLSRKLKEAIIAWRLETTLPKERILEIYLNIAEWGPGLYGIKDAADHYFNRTPAVLKPEEAAFLASLLPSPIRYHRYYHQDGRGLTQNRHERVQEILRTMHRLGSLDPRQYHLARGEAVELARCRF